MALRAFFDECGLNPKTDEFLVVGGFLSSVEEWGRASDAWNESLRQTPEIAYFKSHEAAILDGEFKRFSRASADAKVRKLAQVIATFDLQGFCAYVPHSLLEQRDRRAAKGIVGTRPYDWGFIRAIAGVLNYRFNNILGDDRVDFIFDQRSELRSCIDMYEAHKESGLLEMMRWAGQCIPGTDTDVVALQMSDLLVGEFRKSLANGEDDDILNTLNSRNKVRDLPALPPSATPARLYLQKIAKGLEDETNSLLKRIRGDGEAASAALLNDVVELHKRKALFDAQWNFIEQQDQPSEDARKFLANYRSRKGLK